MKFPSKLAMYTTTLMLAGSRLAYAAQDPQTPPPAPPAQVHVDVVESHTVWYADPFWLALGGVVALIVIVLAIMAARGGSSKTSTTVVR